MTVKIQLHLINQDSFSLTVFSRAELFLRSVSLKNKIIGASFLGLTVAIGGTTVGLLIGNYYQQEAIDLQASASLQNRLLSRLQVAMLETLPTREFVPLLTTPVEFKQHKSELASRLAGIKELSFKLKLLPQVRASKDLNSLLKQGNEVSAKFYWQLNVILKQVEPLLLQPRSGQRAEKLITNYTSGREFIAIVNSAYQLSKYIVTAQKQEDIAASALIKAENLRNLIITVSIMLSVLLAAGLGFFTSRAIACPIEDVTSMAKRISQSADFSLQVPITTSDEIGQLAVVFNNLILAIADYVQKISDKNQELQQAELEIRDSLKLKEVLIKEIHHRVKNNLQIISSLLNLQASYLQDQQIIELLKISQNRISTMALIHEKLYQSENLAQIDLAGYINDLVISIISSCEVGAPTISLKVNIDHILVSLDIAVACGLIVNELVMNSIKYAFFTTSEPEIFIQSYILNTNNKMVLVVGDNGVGLPINIDFKNTESLGLQLVNTLINQLQGLIEYEGSCGAVFTLTFYV